MTENPRFIDDPIHGLIRFEQNDTDGLLLRLIDTAEFQRLRRIRQLGLAEYVFPGATHTRLSHSLGVLHQSRAFLSRFRELDLNLTEQDELVVLVSALLHDAGHGPFSHVFERVTGDSHEKRTLDIIGDTDTGIGRVLSEYDPDLPDAIAAFFEGRLCKNGQPATPAFLSQVISSQLDADRCDYLLRDSHFAGVRYGLFDFQWLVQHLEITGGEEIYVPRKAFTAAESFVLARHHMYTTVYFHRTTRAAEVMLNTLLRRYKQRLADCTNDGERRELVPDAPTTVMNAFSDNKLPLPQYLALDDSALTVFIAACPDSCDPIIAALGWGLMNRQLWKCIDVTHAKLPNVGAFVTEVTQAIEDLGLNDEYAWAYDTPADTPYKPYNPAVAAKPILVEDSNGSAAEITSLSGPLRSLAEEYSLVRYYFPSELRDKILSIAVDKLYGGGN